MIKTPAEAAAGRDEYIRSTFDLACWLPAASSSIEDLRAAIKERFGASFHAKEAVLPRDETWRIRFLKSPIGWLTTGERIRPAGGERMPGASLPTYVRMRVPITKAGIVPRVLAPRKQDLPRLAPGTWKNVVLDRRFFPPTLEVVVDAPHRGIIVVPISADLSPMTIEFPVKKRDLVLAFRALESARAEAKSKKLKEDYANGRPRAGR